jgi:large subunit ribosomal protein L19
MDKVLQATQNDLKTDLPQFQSGDTVSVGVKVIEGTRSRVQTFEGVVIAISNVCTRERVPSITFTPTETVSPDWN